LRRSGCGLTTTTAQTWTWADSHLSSDWPWLRNVSTSATLAKGDDYQPEKLEQSVGEFVEYYNHQRYHESLSNLTPADVYFGRGESILEEMRKIKEQTIQSRRIQHQLETV
jgi:hypothetical protein